jgi:hypothetical protein
MPSGSGTWDFIVGTLFALVLGVLLSWGAVYGLNRYLGPGDDNPQITGTVRYSD